MTAKACPCTSGLPYTTCCSPFHRGEREPSPPEALMRSRFAAYARGEAEYLWRTLHPDHADRAVPKEDVLRALRHATATYKYMRLHIFDAKGAKVLFRASVFEKGKDRSFTELSTFARDGVGWRYVEGVSRPADNREWTIESFSSAPDESAE